MFISKELFEVAEATVRRGGRVVSASVSGSGGQGSDPGGVTWLTCNYLGQVIHSHLLRPTKPFTPPNGATNTAYVSLTYKLPTVYNGKDRYIIEC